MTNNPIRPVTPLQILAELEDVIRVMPEVGKLHWIDNDTLVWVARASAVITMWAQQAVQLTTLTEWNLAINELQGRRMSGRDPNFTIFRIVHQAYNQLRLATVGPVNVAIGTGQVFDYFDEIRKVIEGAGVNILFIDPYMNADFVSRYLPHVKDGVTVRLLASNSPTTAKYLAELKTAAGLFSKQNRIFTEVRAGGELHDRWIFIDRASCHQSGSSFKDGATKAGTTITQNVDAFATLIAHYEALWQAAM